LVVNVNTDDAGSASNCVAQTTPGTTTNSDTCSLRDALLFAATAGAGSISFDSTVFASPQTIALTNGTLTVPNNTTVTGPSAGVTVNGGGSANQVTVFTENSGVTGASIANLN